MSCSCFLHQGHTCRKGGGAQLPLEWWQSNSCVWSTRHLCLSRGFLLCFLNGSQNNPFEIAIMGKLWQLVKFLQVRQKMQVWTVPKSLRQLRNSEGSTNVNVPSTRLSMCVFCVVRFFKLFIIHVTTDLSQSTSSNSSRCTCVYIETSCTVHVV